MKTFETEKPNIPEGATGYREQGKYIEWFGGGFGCWRLIASNVPALDMCDALKPVKPIPQTNIETPEEKEALDSIALRRTCELSKSREREFLDLIDTTPHQYEASKFSGKAKWKNGDGVEAYGKPYKYVGLDPFNDNLCICLANQDDDPQCFSVGEIKKPETPQQREEREKLEAAYDLYCEWAKGKSHKSFCEFKSADGTSTMWLRVIDKTNYRKGVK